MALWHPASDTTLYKLANSYTGPNYFLALDSSTSDSHDLHVSQTDPPIFWYFIPGIDTLLFNICTKQTGEPLCLDAPGGNKTPPHLAVRKDVASQNWTVTNARDGTYKLSNKYSGPKLYLDVYGDTKQASMSSGDFAGQYWSITLAEPPQEPALSKSDIIGIAVGVPSGVLTLIGVIVAIWKR